MQAETRNNLTTSPNKKSKQESSSTDYVSCDAPPLDFSFKNISNLEGTYKLQVRIKKHLAKTGPKNGNITDSCKKLGKTIIDKAIIIRA